MQMKNVTYTLKGTQIYLFNGSVKTSIGVKLSKVGEKLPYFTKSYVINRESNRSYEVADEILKKIVGTRSFYRFGVTLEKADVKDAEIADFGSVIFSLSNS